MRTASDGDGAAHNPSPGKRVMTKAYDVALLLTLAALTPHCGSDSDAAHRGRPAQEDASASDAGLDDELVVAFDALDNDAAAEPLCGSERLCEPDLTAWCTSLQNEDGGSNLIDASASDAISVDVSIADTRQTADSTAADAPAAPDTSQSTDAVFDDSSITDSTLASADSMVADVQADRDAPAEDAGSVDGSRSEIGPRADGATNPDAAATSDVAATPADTARTAEKRVCRVMVRTSSRRAAACELAGDTPELGRCGKDSDCGPGLACIGDPGVEAERGWCLPYCCSAYESGPIPEGRQDYYCTPRQLKSQHGSVPVWVKLDMCTLLGDEQRCVGATGCSVVTNDGKTTCVPTGPAQENQSCAVEACGRGMICTGTTDRRCRKICSLQAGDARCSAGSRCVGSAAMPAGFGLCVFAT